MLMDRAPALDLHRLGITAARLFQLEALIALFVDRAENQVKHRFGWKLLDVGSQATNGRLGFGLMRVVLKAQYDSILDVQQFGIGQLGKGACNLLA